MGRRMSAVGKLAFLAVGLMAGIAQAAPPPVESRPEVPASGRRLPPPERRPEAPKPAASEECFAEVIDRKQPNLRLRITAASTEDAVLEREAGEEAMLGGRGGGCAWCFQNCPLSGWFFIGILKAGAINMTPGAELQLMTGEKGAEKSFSLRGSEKINPEDKRFESVRSVRLKCPKRDPQGAPANPPR